MTLRKMYLVTAADYDASRLQSKTPPPPQPMKTKRVTKRRKTASQHPHDKWVALRTKQLEDDIKETELIHRFADFLSKLLPQPAPQKTPQRQTSAEQHHKIETVETAETPQHSLVAQRPEPPSVVTIYDLSKRRPSSCSDAAKTSGSDDNLGGVYEVSIPYLNTVRFLHEQYGIRRDGNTLTIGIAADTAN